MLTHPNMIPRVQLTQGKYFVGLWAFCSEMQLLQPPET